MEKVNSKRVTQDINGTELVYEDLSDDKEDEPVLWDFVFDGLEHKENVLAHLNKLRKARQLCDISLVIGAHEVPVHRAVVATASPYLFDLFLKQEEDGQQGVCKLKDVEYSSFQYLLEYMYTARLVVPADHVKSVYRTAVFLKMVEAAKACSGYLADNVTTTNCLGIRQFAADDDFKSTLDGFIQNNINEVASSKMFYGLPRVPVVIMGDIDSDLLESSDDKHMFELVLSWAKDNLNPEKPRIDDLTEQTNILHLNKDNTLTDYKDIADDRMEEDIVQDYRKKAKHRPNLSVKPDNGQIQTSPGGNVVRKFSINPNLPQEEKEWSVFATYHMKDNTYMAVAMLNGTMATISIHYRSQSKSTTPGSLSDDPDSPTATNVVSIIDKCSERHASLTPLASMSSARCGFGLCVVQGKLIACGGYDRGECLKSVESYNIKTNEWSLLPSMRTPRGRFSVERIDDLIYALGGSDGHHGQNSLDTFDLESKQWNTVNKCRNNALVSAGVVKLNGKLITIGGCVGQKSVPDCQMYDPKTGQWSVLPSLNSARYQAGVCAYKDKLYAIGGTDGWTCLNTMEILDFETNQWQYGPNLNVPRRGAGCDVVNDKIYLVGGHDGTQSLKSTEILHLERESWVMGSCLSQPRANVAVCFYDNRLFAVGGFSGRTFLDTMEYLNEVDDEWCSYVPVEESVIAQKKAERKNSKTLKNDVKEVVNGDGSPVLNGH